MGHTSYKHLSIVSKHESVLGIPKLSRMSNVARNLWGEAVNTVCHTINRVYFRPSTKKTSYELWKGRKPNVKYFRSLEVLVSFSGIEKMWESLTLGAMKVYFWVTLPQARLIGYTIKEL